MGAVQWMRVFDTVSNLTRLADRFKPRPPDGVEPTATGGGPLEARLAGVLVAALKEAFDRDRARMDLEREQVDSERRQAEQLLNAELRRQAAERAHGHYRVIAVMAIATWMLSAALAVWLPGMHATLPRIVLAAGWACALGALGCAFMAGQAVSKWTASAAAADATATLPANRTGAAAPWLLLMAVALAGASLLVAL